MTNKVTINAEMERKIRAVSEDIDLAQISVFETIAVDNQALSKKGSIWDQGILKESFLAEMRDYIKTGNAVPMIELHEERLPVGKLFDASLQYDEDKVSLHSLFYVPKDSQFESNIQLGILESVSVGITPKKLLCSQCGWDHLGEEAAEGDFWNLWDRTCANGHVIGEDGIHVVAEGLADWRELSFVMKGASKEAKILPKSKQVMGKQAEQDYNAYSALAASGLRNEIVMLLTDRREPKMSTPKDDTMNEEFIAKLTDAKADVKVAMKEKESAEARLAEVSKENEELKAKLEASDSEELEATKTELELAKSYLKDEADKALVASGGKPTEAKGIAELKAEIEKAQVILVKNFKPGGVTQGAETENKELRNLSAYGSNK